MHLKIQPNTTLFEIKSFLHESFPYLDIAFFKTAHHTGEGNRRADLLPNSLHISEAGNGNSGELVVEPGTLVQDLEHAFTKEFGLYAQIMRKSGNVWLQTTTSDNLSLEQINQMAKQANDSEPLPEEPQDYHEQE
ncbi:MAG: hypothetical protein KG003_01710 [Bacteroidetes bacterium]|nr:hypothetical protein [Bacteroidota bacterium]